MTFLCFENLHYAGPIAHLALTLAELWGEKEYMILG
jgi:hypothetical protein